MFSTNKTEVIVVAPDHYGSLARRMVHKLSKYPNISAVFWNISHYKDNESTQTGDRNIIFIGDSNENEFTEIYLECMSELKEDDGAKVGLDGSRAVIFGEGNPDISFSDIIARGEFAIAGKALPLIFIAFGAPFVAGGAAGYEYYQLNKEDQKKRAKQVDHGIDIFIEELFEKWVELEKKAT